MAVNVSGGLANARRKQKKMQAQRSANIKKLRKDQKAQDANDQSDNFDDNQEQAEPPEEFHQTKLGRLLELIETPIIVLIILNALQMGLGTFNFVTQNPSVEETFELVDQVFLIIFTVEVFLNFLHYIRIDRVQLVEGKLSYRSHSAEEDKERLENRYWLYFDASVVIFSWAFSSLSIIRAFRILRILRLISKVESLKSVVNALIKVMPRMGLVAFLLCLMLLVFGIAFTMLFSDLHANGHTKYDYFSRIDLTFLTLFQIMTFDSWQGIAREVMAVYPWAWVLFVMWVVLTGFVVMNLIIAIICESLVTMTEEKKVLEELHKKAILKLELQGKSLTKEESKRVMLETQKNIQSLKSVNTLDTEDNMFHLENMVEEILADQEDLLETVEKLRDILAEVLVHPPNEGRMHEIHTLFRLRPVKKQS